MTEPSQYFKGRTVQEQMDEVIGYVDVRSAEVATTAIASDVAQVHQDMLDADADAAAAAASAAAAAGTLANAVKKTGEASQSIAGDIAVSGDLSAGGDLDVTGDAGVQGDLSVLGDCDFNAEVKVRTPVNNTDAANKKFVSDSLDNYATMVRTATEQTIADPKHFVNYVDGCNSGKVIGMVSGSLVANRSGYVELVTINLQNNRGVRFLLIGGANNTNYCEAEYTLTKGTGSPVLRCTYKAYSSGNVKPELWIYDDSGVIRIYGIRLQYAFQSIAVICYFNTGSIQSLPTNTLVKTENPGVEVTLPTGAVQEVYLQRDS